MRRASEGNHDAPVRVSSLLPCRKPSAFLNSFRSRIPSKLPCGHPGLQASFAHARAKTIVWADDNNKAKTRPDYVTVNLFKDGQQIDSQNVVQDKNGIWLFDFEVSGSLDDAAYTITKASDSRRPLCQSAITYLVGYCTHTPVFQENIAKFKLFLYKYNFGQQF